MAIWQATNVLTGAVEGPKYIETGVVTEIWSVLLTTALASGDTINGPVIPAGCYLDSFTVDTDSLDSSTGVTFEAGYASHLAAFIKTGNATAQGGGIQGANAAGTVGFASTSNVTTLVTITHVATTAVQGTMRIKVTYTASP